MKKATPSQEVMAKKPRFHHQDRNSHMNGHLLPAAARNGDHASPSSSTLSCNRMIVVPEMASFCFETLLRYLKRDSHNNGLMRTFTNDRYPLFVSWHTGKEHHLRGCIGTFTPLNLHQGLQEYAITSATKDSRFSPIQLDEVHKLTVSVSLLINFEDAEDYLDWEVGVHGIRIEFSNERGHQKTATYLPNVAPEQGWNKVQTVDNLLRKGGHKGHISQQFRSSIKVVRYQSDKLEMSYNEHLAFVDSRRAGDSSTALQ